jgi:hypothetical protein
MWKGDKSNPSPNTVQEPMDRSEKMIAENRAEQTRRDTDTQKNFTITLYDIDETILSHLEQLQLQVVDVGKKVKVPIIYGSPERWVSAQRDGYLRDKQGKILLPAIIFKRTSSENDASLQFFNRYLNTPVIKLYSQKNQYTKFTMLAGQNAPVNEVYNVIVPSHMVLTYHFIIWTDSVEQMNTLVETIQFNTKDYWGSRKGFRFRTKINTYSHTVELQANEDRVVKTEFDLSTHGYILPDAMTKLDRHQMTTTKMFTPKKIIMGMEVVSTGYDFNAVNKNREKWRNPNYPNIQADVNIPAPPISVNTDIIDNSYGIRVDNSPLFLRIVPVPTTQAAGGQDGSMSYDAEYFYFHANGMWKRVAISEFLPACSDGAPVTGTEGSVVYNSSFLYIYSKGMWRKVAISEFDLNTSGEEGNIMYDTAYFYIYTGGAWRRVAISAIT